MLTNLNIFDKLSEHVSGFDGADTVLDVRSNVVCHFSNLVSSTRVRGDLVINCTQTSYQEGVEWSKGALYMAMLDS